MAEVIAALNIVEVVNAATACSYSEVEILDRGGAPLSALAPLSAGRSNKKRCSAVNSSDRLTHFPVGADTVALVLASQ